LYASEVETKNKINCETALYGGQENMGDNDTNRQDQSNPEPPLMARVVEPPLVARLAQRPGARWRIFWIVLAIVAGTAAVLSLLWIKPWQGLRVRPIAKETAEEKFKETKSAFSGDAAIVRDEELKGIEEALRGFRDALAAQDPEAINQLFDLRRFVDEVVSTGLLKFRPSEMDDAVRGAGVALSTALAKNHSLYGFARFEIKKCTFNEDRDEAIAYVRISNSDGVAAKFRYWFSYHDNQWRLFDLEDLAGGMRLSSGAATIGAEIHPRDHARFLATAQTVPQITRALIAGDVDKAEEFLGAIDVTIFPVILQAVVEWQRAAVHLARERFQLALDACNASEQLNPNLPLVLLLRAAAYNGLGRFEEGRADAQKYLDTLGDDADGYLHLGLALAGLGKQDEAIRAFESGLKDDPNSTDLLYQLALHLPEAKLDILNEHLGKVEKPSEQFKALAPLLESDYRLKALDALVNWYAAIAPDDPELKYYRARRQVARAQFQEAVATLKELLAADADETARKNYRATYEQAMIELGRATEAYNDARDSEAEEAFATLAAGVVFRPEAKEQLASLIGAHEKRLPNSPSLDYYRGELAALHEKWAEAVALLKKGLEKAPDDVWKQTYRERLVRAMYEAGQAVAAHDEFAGDAAVFEQLARLAVFDSNATVLSEIIARQAKLHADNPQLAFYRAELAKIGGNWDAAIEFYRAALKRADEQEKLRLRWALFQAMYKAGRSMAAYDESDGDESVFGQLISNAEADKNVDLVEALISAHQKRQADPKYLQFWRARTAAMRQDWKKSLEVLEQNASDLEAIPGYKWRARELYVQALLKTGATDEARSMAKRHWEEDRHYWTSLVVAVTERNIAEAERWIKQHEADGMPLEDLFWDAEIAESLRSEAFKPLLEKYEGLQKAAAEMEK
jgi:tetratricopeptide (TPR) repeat protein